jgi:hypothetical protein
MRGLMRLAAALLLVWFAAISSVEPAVAQADTAAASCAAYPQSGFVRPVTGQLPVHPWSSAAEIAAFVMPYALMAQDANSARDDNLGSYGFYRGPNSNEILMGIDQLHADVVGFYATTFIHCSAHAVVIVYRSLSNFDVRDYVVGLVRQIVGGESTMPLIFFDRVKALYPGYAIMVVGHSSGGGLASYVGAVEHVPSIAFNPVLFDAALLNPGDQQLVIRITGDIYSDPAAGPAPAILRPVQNFLTPPRDIRGQILRIEPQGTYPRIWQLHWISVIIDELNRIMN